jgi:hypothetical protein
MPIVTFQSPQGQRRSRVTDGRAGDSDASSSSRDRPAVSDSGLEQISSARAVLEPALLTAKRSLAIACVIASLAANVNRHGPNFVP